MKRRTRFLIATALAITAMLFRPRHAGDGETRPDDDGPTTAD